MKRAFDLIAFDADDTLWHNERIFHATQEQFQALLSQYHTPEWIGEQLFATETRNLAYFGYGVKGFTLSMVETAIELTEGRITGSEIQRIIDWGRSMLAQPIELLEGVRETVQALSDRYALALVTKGDLFDQENKLARSGLGDLFSAVEIISEKDEKAYAAVMKRHSVEPHRFLMVGNSIKSDVLPVLLAGGSAVHVPYPITWAHEVVAEEAYKGKPFATLEHLGELPAWIEARERE